MTTYALGPWHFSPAEYCISDGTTRKELEPLLSKMLLCFVQHAGHIVSRQQLVDNVWQQSFVDDNAINRAISELRKALLHPSLVQSPIKTHHRKGYSLQLETTQLTNADTEVPALQPTTTSNIATPSQHKKRPALWLAAPLLAVLAAVGGYLHFNQSDTEQPVATSSDNDKPEIVPVTLLQQQKVSWLKGIESRPQVSPDKQLLAYTHTQADGSMRVMVRQAALTGSTALQEVALQQQGALFNLHSWRPQSRQLLVQQMARDGSECQYISYNFADFPNYETNRLTSCNGPSLSVAQQSLDGQQLYYGQSSGGLYSANALMVEDLQTGIKQTLVAAPLAGIGVSMLALSADGSQLAYTVMTEAHTIDIYLYNPNSREHIRLASLPFAALLLGLEWSTDQQSLLIPGGDSILVLNIADKALRVLKMPEGAVVGELSLVGNNQAYTSGLTAQSATQNSMQLLKIQHPFDESKRRITPVFDHAGSAFGLAVSPTDSSQFAFAANWSGSWQLWLNNNGQNSVLTEFSADQQQPLNSVSWSSDGRYIAFIRTGDVYLYDTQRKQLISKLQNQDAGQVRWLPDDSGLVMTRLNDNKQSLWQLDLVSNELWQLTTSTASFAQFDQQGTLYYHRDGALYQYLDGAKADKQIIASNDSIYVAKWQLLNDARYRFSMLGHIEQYDDNHGLRSVQLPYQFIDLHPQPHSPDVLYATAFITPELALEFIQWQEPQAE